MIPNYVPILKAKQGEFDSQDQLSTEVRKKILPLFELSKFTESSNKLAICKNKANPVECYLNQMTHKIAACRGKLPIMLDMFHWAPNSAIESGEHILNYAVNRLTSMGVSVIPVIGYDRWEDIEYSSALGHIYNSTGKFCIRLESYAFEDMEDPDHFLSVLDEIINTLNLNTSLCNILLDFGDVTTTSIIDIQHSIENSLEVLSLYDFEFISISGCSITTFVNGMVAEKDSTGVVIRREMVAWQACRRSARLVFGDYGISNPGAAGDVIAPDANGKIRYTIKKHYFVARGHSRRQGNKGEQMYDLSNAVINSAYFMGPKFSWGDDRITRCSNEEFKGNLCNWVAIDTNHHVNAVLSEVFEFENNLITAKLRTKV